MAVKVFHLKDATAAGSSHGSLADGTAQATATTGTGWTVAKTAATNKRIMQFDAEVSGFATSNTAVDTATLGTSDAWRSENRIVGRFANTAWAFRFSLIAVSAGGTQDGNLRIRVYKSANADGSGATQLTSAIVSTGVVTNLATAAAQTVTASWTPGSILTFNNEYLFVQVDWLITGAGGANGCDVLFRTNSADSIVTTSDFTQDFTGTLGATEGFADSATITGTVVDADRTGTLAATETFSDSATITGSHGHTGTIGATETAADSATITGSWAHAATLAATETASDTSGITGTVVPREEIFDGVLFDNVAFDATATDPTGTLSATETASDTATITGSHGHTGTIGGVESSDGSITTGASNGTTYNSASNELNCISLAAPAGPITHFTIPLGSTVTAGDKFKGVIYTRGTGALSQTYQALVATSNEVTIVGGQTSMTLTFAAPVSLTPGTLYWFGTHGSGGTDLVQTGSGSSYYQAGHVYASGPPAGPNTFSAYATAFSIVVGYTGAGDSASMTGTVASVGSLSATETGQDSATITGTVVPAVTGSVSGQETGQDSATITGGVTVAGTLAGQETGSDTAGMTGTVVPAVTGTLAGQETGQDSAAIAGSVVAPGDMALNAVETGSDSASIAGSVESAGQLAGQETGQDTATIAGRAGDATGTLGAVEGGQDTAAITGEAEVLAEAEAPAHRGGGGNALPLAPAHRRRRRPGLPEAYQQAEERFSQPRETPESNLQPEGEPENELPERTGPTVLEQLVGPLAEPGLETDFKPAGPTPEEIAARDRARREAAEAARQELLAQVRAEEEAKAAAIAAAVRARQDEEALAYLLALVA